MVLKFTKDQRWKIKDVFVDFNKDEEVKDVPEDILNEMIAHNYVQDDENSSNKKDDESNSGSNDEGGSDDTGSGNNDEGNDDKEPDDEKLAIIEKIKALGGKPDKRKSIDSLRETLVSLEGQQ